jgi:plastocyanin
MTLRLIAPVTIALALSAACGSPAAPPAAPAGGGKTVDAATAGTLSGKVLFKGTPPVRETFKMGTDTVCLQGSGPNPQSDAILVAADGAIQNVFVYIKDGIDPAYTFDVPVTPVTLDQKGCIYTPRVIGVRAGQPIDVINSDATLHNVHALPKANQEFNHPQSKVAEKMTKVFTVPEVMVRFKCDVHGWMAAYVGVMANPYFAVTGADGSFEIKGLPPGTYTVEAWHEKLGTQTTKVTIAEHQTQTASFTFDESAAKK